jgi:hypothetical protein
MKHRFEGLAEVDATIVMMLLAANPSTFPLTVGPWGKIIHWAVKGFFLWGLDKGLKWMNVGVARLETAGESNDLDSAFDEGWKIIDERKKDLTDAQKAKIDERVKRAHRKFGRFGVLVNNGNP